MAKKAASGQAPALPDKFDPKATYTVVVARSFWVARTHIRPGIAMLRGDIADRNRASLASAWVSE